jgi:hypothetical protein
MARANIISSMLPELGNIVTGGLSSFCFRYCLEQTMRSTTFFLASSTKIKVSSMPFEIFSCMSCKAVLWIGIYLMLIVIFHVVRQS